MKRNDSGDFCVLYVEPADDRSLLFATLTGQKKPVVMLLAEQVQVFQRPEDFVALKHLKRQLDLPIIFVIASSELLTQMAGRYGFPVYLSMDALANALAAGQLARQRTINRPTSPLSPGGPRVATLAPPVQLPKKTIPLTPSVEISARTTLPLAGSTSDPLARVLQSNVPLASPPPLIQEQPPVKERPVLMTYAQPPKKHSLPAGLLILTFVGLLLAGLGSSLVLFNKLPSTSVGAAAPTVFGHVTFLSSEQLSENSSQGISDQVLIDLSHLPAPQAPQAYYAWLLGDTSVGDPQTIALGQLTLTNGNVHLLYPGDAHHTNLLQITSRFLITEEDATVPPISPTPDLNAWRFYGEFSQTLMPNSSGMGGMEGYQSFTYLDHLRHLLAAEPLLDQMELPGGLNNWFYTNTGNVLEWAGSTRQAWEDGKDIAFVRRQAVRVLAYLDGLSFVHQDLAPDTPLGINDRLAGIGLLQVNGANQDPPSYMAEIVHHLSGLLQASDAPADLRKAETDLLAAMNNVQLRLSQVRHDAQQLMKMSDQQLLQPATLSLINDMIDNANHAYVGQVDPATGDIRQGVIWIHAHMQSLAVLTITPFSPAKTPLQTMSAAMHMSVQCEPSGSTLC